MHNLYKLKSLDELMGQIEMGMDIEFQIYDVRYNISWRDDKPFICKCPDGEYQINGKVLQDIWQDFEIIFM